MAIGHGVAGKAPLHLRGGSLTHAARACCRVSEPPSARTRARDRRDPGVSRACRAKPGCCRSSVARRGAPRVSCCARTLPAARLYRCRCNTNTRCTSISRVRTCRSPGRCGSMPPRRWSMVGRCSYASSLTVRRCCPACTTLPRRPPNAGGAWLSSTPERSHACISSTGALTASRNSCAFPPARNRHRERSCITGGESGSRYGPHRSRSLRRRCTGSNDTFRSVPRRSVSARVRTESARRSGAMTGSWRCPTGNSHTSATHARTSRFHRVCSSSGIVSGSSSTTSALRHCDPARQPGLLRRLECVQVDARTQ